MLLILHYFYDMYEFNLNYIQLQLIFISLRNFY